MPKRLSPFKGEGQEGEVRHPQPVMLSAVKHPHWIPRYARNDITCHAERSEASTHWIHLALAKHCLQ
jgi:hypothetical protein